MSSPSLPAVEGLDFTCQPYQGTADLGDIRRIRAAIQVLEPRAWPPGPDTEDEADHERFCLIGSVAGQAVAFTWMVRWAEVDGTLMWLLLGGVDPAARGRGIGRALLSWQERAALAHAVQQHGRVPQRAVFGANADDDQPTARGLLLAAGYRVAFTVVSMALACDAVGSVQAPLPGGLADRPVGAQMHRRIHAAIEEAFAQSRRGHVPRSFEEYLRDVEARRQDPHLWCVAWDGDEVAGVVIAERAREGEVNLPWVAVRPGWRRRGLAQAMLRTVIARCAADAVHTVRISTVQENENQTVRLYEQVGFRVTQRHPRYRKPMRSAEAAA